MPNLTKRQVETYVDALLPSLIHLLVIEDYEITYETMKSSSKKAKALGLDDVYAAVRLTNTKAHIILMYNEHLTEQDVFDSLLHELLHVRLNRLRAMAYLTDAAREEDEKIVQALTDLIRELFYEHNDHASAN